MVIGLLLLACGDPLLQDDAEMSPVELLTRASLDFRGVRPSVEEIEQVEASPESVESLIDTFLDDERLPERLVALYQEVFLSQTEGIDLRPANVPFPNPWFFYWEIGQEPIRLLAQVAYEDLPYTEVVTADWTMANEDIAAFSPVTWTEGDLGWHKVQYTDGRPAAGVIATNGLWWRYTTTEANANRRRANALTRILVCDDYLARPIAFDQSTNLLDEAAVADALHNNKSCLSCHVSLDPIAANLFGFYWSNFTSPTEGRVYHASKEGEWRDLIGVAPGWYGTPVSGLSELGGVIAADPRFVRCGVQTAYELLLRRKVSVEDEDELTALREVFLASDLRLKPLYRAIVDSPFYRAGAMSDDERAVPVKMMTPDVLAASIEGITGYSWFREGQPVMATDRKGVRALAGGVEGVLIKAAARQPDATVLLVQEALASEAAAFLVSTELSIEPSSRNIFTEIDFFDDPASNEDRMRAQLQRLHLLVLSHRVDPDGPEVDAGLALWQQLYSVQRDPSMAWQGVLTALLRDPSYLLY